MNYPRIVVAAVAATVVFFIYGFLVHGWLIAKDYVPYPEGVYRSGDDARSHLLLGLTGIFIAILAFAAIYAKATKMDGAWQKAPAWACFSESSWQAHLLRSTTAPSISVGSSRWSWRQRAHRVDARGHRDRPRVQACKWG
jgi:hypothetical protein